MDDIGNVSPELKSPFAYLRVLTDEIRVVTAKLKGKKTEKKNGGKFSAVPPRLSSSLFPSGVPEEIRTSLNPLVSERSSN